MILQEKNDSSSSGYKLEGCDHDVHNVGCAANKKPNLVPGIQHGSSSLKPQPNVAGHVHALVFKDQYVSDGKNRLSL